MTEETAPIARNTALQIIGKVIGIALGLLTVAILLRYLKESGFGEFTTAITYLSIFAVVVDFGLTLTTVQMISEPGADEPKILGNIFALRLISGLVVFVIAPIIALLFPYPGSVKLAILVGSLGYFFSSTSQMLVGVFQKRLMMWRVVVAELVSRTVLLLGSILVMATGGSLIEVIIALVLGNFAQTALTIILARPLVAIRSQIDLEVWKEIIRRSWPIGVSILFNVIYLRGDILFLSLYRSQEEVGLYGAAYKIIDVITALPVLFMGLILPLLVASWKSGAREKFARLMQQAFDFFALVGVPIAVGSFALAEPLMTLVGGQAFAASGAILQILAPTLFIVFIGALFGHAVVAVHKQKPMVIGYAVSALVAIAAYLILIPLYGTLGAAWVTLLSEGLVALLTFLMVKQTTGMHPRLTVFTKSLTAALLMFVLLQVTDELPVLVQILLGTIAYGAVIVALGALNLQTIRALFLKQV